ncbi:MAG: hypothetical protein KF843_05580 [Flavobacteriales bacterium]|nr:hypothetical protein [Flavobacteriales bacterium]
MNIGSIIGLNTIRPRLQRKKEISSQQASDGYRIHFMSFLLRKSNGGEL